MSHLPVRFFVRAHGVREPKDRMTREILSEFDKGGIQVASATSEIVGLPPLKVEVKDIEEVRTWPEDGWPLRHSCSALRDAE